MHLSDADFPGKGRSPASVPGAARRAAVEEGGALRRCRGALARATRHGGRGYGDALLCGYGVWFVVTSARRRTLPLRVRGRSSTRWTTRGAL